MQVQGRVAESPPERCAAAARLAAATPAGSRERLRSGARAHQHHPRPEPLAVARRALSLPGRAAAMPIPQSRSAHAPAAKTHITHIIGASTVPGTAMPAPIGHAATTDDVPAGPLITVRSRHPEATRTAAAITAITLKSRSRAATRMAPSASHVPTVTPLHYCRREHSLRLRSPWRQRRRWLLPEAQRRGRPGLSAANLTR